ncbi:MAG: hypothetical protein E6G41_18805, partial [Actinobacteria bacterium]
MQLTGASPRRGWGARSPRSPGRGRGSCRCRATRQPSQHGCRTPAACAGPSPTTPSARSGSRTIPSGARSTACSGSARRRSGTRTRSAASRPSVACRSASSTPASTRGTRTSRARCAPADGVVTDGDCADSEGHGTHVAGTIGALANNRAGVAGVAFNSPLIVCRALGGADGSGTVADVAACIRWAHVRGAKVISMSLGGPASRTLAEAAKTAYARGGRSGSLLVAAAGNDGDGTTEYPAGLDQVVSVAATDATDNVAPFSNQNPDV